MKFLCVCQYGHSRSVCLARALQARSHEATAVGWDTAASAIPVLSGWADKVIVLQKEYLRYVPGGIAEVFDVGPDRWSNPYNAELRAILDKMIDAKGW